MQGLPRSHGWVAVAITALLACGCDRDEGDLVLVGTVERTLVELAAPVSEVVMAVPVERGERVAPWQVLVELDPTLALALVMQAEARLASARTAAGVADQERSRITELHRGDVASQQQLDRARLEHDEGAARLREARALLAAAHKRMRDLALASPTPGVVDQLPFDVGERVPAGAVLAVVLSDDDPWVRVWVPERSAARVAPGTPAWIEIDGIGTLHGKVLDVAREPQFTPHFALTERDRVHLVYQTRVTILDAPASLRPGVPASVTLLLDDSGDAEGPT